ncbi:ComF family protein [Salinibacterium sp. PAMC 21357]|uniref:ComF family protein n=1 Tax=Salinibacterium sp. PAMC 21357 TaxID=1112215 RepID=UPI0002F7FDC4|nr:phosphoribosyltransferase family protein [Salinibacterium sp. PAMC 21357]
MTSPENDDGGWLRRFVAKTLDALRDAWAVLMPVECAGCDSDDRALCAECTRSLVAEPTVHSTPRHVRVFAALYYEGRVRRVVLAFKNHHRTDQARPLARALLPALHRAIEESAASGETEAPVLIVAVPTSKRAFRTRGYHPMSLVLRSAGVRHERVLRATKVTASQKLLSARQRATNVQGAFVATRWLGSARVIIVDDVLTTGATIDEASRAICAAGGTVVAAVTIGFTPRTGASRDNAST